MKTVNFMLAAIALLLGFTACMDDKLQIAGSSSKIENTPIVFTASFDDGWDGVSSVGVMIDGTVKEYSVTATDNTSATLSSDDPHYWGTDSNDITVTAWWPYTEGEVAPPNVVVNADQSTSSGFEGSNFVSAEGQAVSYSDPTLTFTNRTARVTVNVTASEVPQSVKLTSLSTANGNPSEITAYNTSAGTYVALVAPQTLSQGTVSITCVFGDGDLNSEQSETEWQAGEEYTYTVSRVVAGSGYTYDSITNTYTVSTANGLLAWNEAAQSDPTLNCTLSADISLSGTWTPVGNYSNPYTGTFEGGNHTITGLTTVSGSRYTGLIGKLGSDGKVQNLTLSNMSVTGGSDVGGVVGENSSGTVTNCTTSGSISGSGSRVGGVVGFTSSGGTVTNCTTSASVSGSMYYVGGVVGYNYGAVTSCTSSGSVTGNSYVGGVVGDNSGSVTSCTSSGNVSGSTIGGVVGKNSGGTVFNCSASGNVSSSAYSSGGVVGWNVSGIITACYASGNVSSGGNYAGGVAGNNSSGTITACYHVTGSVSASGMYVGGVVGYNTYTSGSVTACYSTSSSVTGGSYVGSVVGFNHEGSVTACYYATGSVSGDSNVGDGIGYDKNGTGEATEVDGTTVDWWTATGFMNLKSDTTWQYAQSSNPPTLNVYIY